MQKSEMVENKKQKMRRSQKPGSGVNMAAIHEKAISNGRK